MSFKRIIFIIVLFALFTSCGSKKAVVNKKSDRRNHPVVKVGSSEDRQVLEPSVRVPNSVEQYIDYYSGIAMEEMRLYGIPASITLAQGILESASGNGRLAIEANNHFGIKCHDWTGARIYHDDDKKGECFRKYKDPKYSFQDHSVFLSTRKRYHKLFMLDKDDYKGWARELKAAGYATDTKYPKKLIGLIERYGLYRFDAEVLGKSSNRKNSHTVVSGDTLYSLSRKYEISVEEIKRLNGLDSNYLFVGQVLLIKPMPRDF